MAILAIISMVLVNLRSNLAMHRDPRFQHLNIHLARYLVPLYPEWSMPWPCRQHNQAVGWRLCLCAQTPPLRLEAVRLSHVHANRYWNQLTEMKNALNFADTARESSEAATR